MPGPRPALCTFPEDFLQEALDTVSRRTVAVQTVQRFRLVLLLHEQPCLGNDEAAEAVGLPARQVGVTGGKQRSGARELARSFPHRTEKDRIASSYSAETLGQRKGRCQGLSVWSG